MASLPWRAWRRTERGSAPLRRATVTEQGPQAHDFSRGSRAFPLRGGADTRMVVAPSCDGVLVVYRLANKTVY